MAVSPLPIVVFLLATSAAALPAVQPAAELQPSELAAPLPQRSDSAPAPVPNERWSAARLGYASADLDLLAAKRVGHPKDSHGGHAVQPSPVPEVWSAKQALYVSPVVQWSVPFSLGAALLLGALALWYLEQGQASDDSVASGVAARIITSAEAKAGGAAGDAKPAERTRIGWYDNVKLWAIIGVAIDHANNEVPGALAGGTPPVLLSLADEGPARLAKWAVPP